MMMGSAFPQTLYTLAFAYAHFLSVQPSSTQDVYSRLVIVVGGNDIKTRPSMLARFVASSSFLQIKGRVMQLQLPSVSRRRGVR